MSAAEGMKALEVRLSDLDHWFPDGIAAQQSYLAALPQIVAVVEAAERGYDGFADDDAEFYASQKRLVWALAALDEKLTGAEASPTPERT